MLDNEFPGRNLSVVTAGGIAEGSGAAAAFVLGAEGVVIGTGFIATGEAVASQFQKDLIS